MSGAEIKVDFAPEKLRAYRTNETCATIHVKNNTKNLYWCECDIIVSSPLSLSSDSQLDMGRQRMGIIGPGGTSSKRIRLYTRPNNYPDNYRFEIRAFLYDQDGAIAERVESKASIVCINEVHE
jgi:hypothetical protein